MYVLTHTIDAVQVLAAGAPDPGGPEAPPGAEQFMRLMRWLMWGVFACCVVGVLVSAGRMAIAHNRGHGGPEGVVSLAWALVACVLAGSASAIVGTLM